ncbi:leucine-rich repeat and IQ domain-containing protein 1 isoform X1 [Sebastes umbrosus]|uniref:leucine-rich repeat and IQ domain-containing protein 1 isoform X1 n=1 Tax=Sebastes umbrosus TaxID=72105 RepID=UPI00189F84DD|nr:leucine-rich repeat and IQ domain-containing protein 1 isoform X1 [Sebastes umbrosus]
MDSDEVFDTIMFELNNQVISDPDESPEEQERFTLHEETDSDDIPPSLLSYFETSKSRAAVCEKLILEDLEDFTASHDTEDMMSLPFELDKDMMKLSEQVISHTENEENNTSSDTRLFPAPTEALFTHNVSVCPNNEDEYMESEKHLALEYEAERERRHCEEMKKEEQKRQIERDFQKELKKIIEAEKLHQKELELMGKRAQEKLEQELLLQQEIISNLQRRVEEERRMREEEQKRMKDEEDKRKGEEVERKRMEEESRRKKEEEKKIEEMKLKKEEERKREEEEKRRREREEKRKREEERKKLEDEMRIMKEEESRRKKEEEKKIEEMKLKKEEERKREEEEKRRREREEKRKREEERKKLEDEMRIMKEEEERKKKEEEERIKKEEEEKRKREEERKKIEEARKKIEKEKRTMEEEMSRKKEEERKKREEETMRREEEVRIIKEVEERKKQEEVRKKKEEEEALHEEMRKRDEKEHVNVNEEIKLKRKKKEENDKKRKKEEARKKEKERTTMKEVKEVVRKKETKEEPILIEEDEKRKREDDRKPKEEERRRRQKEEMRQEYEEGYKIIEEEIKLKDDEEDCKRFDMDNRRMEHESKTKDKEKKQEDEEAEKRLAKEIRKREEERNNIGAERELKEEEVGKNKKQVYKKTEEEIRLKEKEESKKRVVHDREEEGRRANELQKNRETNHTNIELDNSTTWTSHSESTTSPTSTETIPQQHDPEENISQTSIDKTVGCENQAAGLSTVSVILPVCLPERTEKKRLAWMKDCVPWSKLSLQNRRKQKGSVRSRRGLRGAAEAGSLPPLCPDALLQSTGWKSLQEVTTVTLEDLPGCSLSTLAQCTQLRSLTLRRCGLKSLEGINQLPQLCYIDAQENNISFVDCENMSSLRVLRLGHNKLTSIHGLAGAENVDVLDLSHNSITRIAGLESMKRLQRLSVDHNQLISTKGLRDVYTLLHLNCSHNHLARVEGLENSALLNTLDLRANSLTEPPSLNNQVLLRELHLDDNSISSLQGLTACWLPLMQHLSVAQNRLIQLPSMSDSVSLSNLDLRFNCLSELQNVCESMEGCLFLREVHLTGNPLQQESGWRSTLQKAVPGLRAIDEQKTDSFLTPPAVQQVSLASGSFLTFCQAQLQQTRDLQQQHSRELSNASSSLDAVKTSCRHFTEALQLAKDQRFAHEYGDTSVADKHRAAGQTTPEETLDMDSTNAEKRTERPEMESTGKVQPVLPNRDRCSYWTFEKSAAESWHDTFNTVTTGPTKGPLARKANSGDVHSSATKIKTTLYNLEMAPVSSHQDLDLQNTAAVVIQQLWRKYRQKCGNISSFSTAEEGGGRGGDGGKPESGPSYNNGSVIGRDYAATVIQAFWRGFSLRRRLASALAAVTCPDTGEDDTFEEVDVDEFVFDEAALEKHWTLPLSEDSPSRRYPLSEQPPSLKPPCHFPEPSQYILPPPLVWRPKQAWVSGEHMDSARQRVSPESSNRSKSPASTSVLSGLSERSEKIVEEWGFTDSHTALLMLKRAQKMKSTTQRQKKHRDPSVRLALFRNCSYQLAPVEARNRPAQLNRNDRKVGEAELGLQQAEKVERVKQERAQQWLHTQAAHPDSDPESVHFLPEISPDVLNGGRVQLVADPGYTERLHHASGLWANNSSAAQASCKESNYPRRNSLGHARKEVPSPQRVSSAPSKRERISHRENPVQLSGGWGGGKKRDKVYK